jgi:integrase/recombinase XerC/integrase/recombinase XerD
MNKLPQKVAREIEAVPQLDAFMASFLEAQDVRDSSKDTYRKGLKQFLLWLKGTGIRAPSRQTVLDYKKGLRERGLSSFTVSAYIVVVRKFFDWLESTRGLPNIARGIKGAKRVRGFRKDPLTLPQVKELLASIERTSVIGQRDYALINLLIRTGLRTIEVIQSNTEDIRQQGGEALFYIRGKGRDEKDEFVVLTPETLKPIHEYLKARGNGKKDAPLFESLSDRNRDGRLTTRTLRNIVKDRLRAIGIENDRLTAHSLRHTAVTLALQAGASVQEAQAMARHANINTTLIYSHNIDRVRDAPERKIDVLLSNSP